MRAGYELIPVLSLHVREERAKRSHITHSVEPHRAEEAWLLPMKPLIKSGLSDGSTSMRGGFSACADPTSRAATVTAAKPHDRETLPHRSRLKHATAYPSNRSPQSRPT